MHRLGVTAAIRAYPRDVARIKHLVDAGTPGTHPNEEVFKSFILRHPAEIFFSLRLLLSPRLGVWIFRGLDTFCRATIIDLRLIFLGETFPLIFEGSSNK